MQSLGGVRRRHDFGDEPGGGLFKNPSRLALRVMQDFAARRGLRLARDARLLEREAVGPTDVPVHALQEDRVARRNGVEVCARRPLAAPKCVIPTAPRNPTPRPRLGDALGDAPLRLFERARAVQVDAQEREAAAREMDVRVVEAGRHETALQVNLARRRVARPQVARRADGDDATALNGHRLGQRPARVGGEDFAIEEQEFDRLPPLPRVRERGGERERADESDGKSAKETMLH